MRQALKTFEVEIRLRNNLLKQRRIELGLSPREFAEKAGLNYGSYLKLEGLRESPLGSRGEWRQCARRVADFLRMLPDDLFPSEVLAVEQNRVTTCLSPKEMRSLCEGSTLLEPPALPSAGIEEHDVRKALCQALSFLNKREKKVITSRFGLRGKPKTLEELSKDLGVGGERVRQIEQKALRKLRQPWCKAPLYDAMEGSDLSWEERGADEFEPREG